MLNIILTFLKLFKEEAKAFTIAEIMPFIEVILFIPFLMYFSLRFLFLFHPILLHCLNSLPLNNILLKFTLFLSSSFFFLLRVFGFYASIQLIPDPLLIVANTRTFKSLYA